MMVVRWLVVVILFPLVVLLAAVMLLNDLLYLLLCRWWRRPPKAGPASETPNAGRASVVVLNWNGKELLAECLPSVVEAVEHEGGEHELIVVDNGSTDGSLDLLRERFPRVRVVALDKNYYFGGGNNAGARAASNDIVVFLNNDMRVDKGFLRPLLEPFSSDDVFAVSSQIFFEDPGKPREETGKTRAQWRRGLIDYRHEAPAEADGGSNLPPIFWMGGGSSAVDRRKFLELGGFDPLYHPFYVEDTDVSYQAWKRGWRILFCPESRVIHKHRASSSRFGRDFVERTISRNQLLFIWKSVTEVRYLPTHLAFLPLTYLHLARRHGALGAARVVVAATARLPQALYRRNRLRRWHRRSDAEVFRVANDPFLYKQQYVPPRQVRRGEALKLLFTCPYLPSETHFGGEQMLSLLRGLSQRH
ncbi:MAG TPA: glycosyltransferase family 2 protein, partial [Dehalococcoidia bacterium]|nr:glycosyltransferase family 2 protein [Dehalococcoidia bacterium]